MNHRQGSLSPYLAHTITLLAQGDWVAKGTWAVFLDWLITKWKWDKETRGNINSKVGSDRDAFPQVCSQTRLVRSAASWWHRWWWCVCVGKTWWRRKVRGKNSSYMWHTSAPDITSPRADQRHLRQRGSRIESRWLCSLFRKTLPRDANRGVLFPSAVLAAFNSRLEVEFPSQGGNIFMTEALADIHIDSTFLLMNWKYFTPVIIFTCACPLRNTSQTVL